MSDSGRTISLAIVPLLAMVCALLGDPVEAAGVEGDLRPHVALVESHCCSVVTEAASQIQGDLPMGSTPAPRAGRLRVKESDRIGPARLHLPPPGV